MRRFFPLVGLIFFVTCFSTFFLFQLQFSSGVFAFDANLSIWYYTKEIARTVFQGVVMLAGIIFGFLYRRTQEAKGAKFNVGAEFKAIWSSTAFYQSLFAAPLVFCSVYVFTRTVPDSAASLIFAFQNGFFCKVIMEKAQNSQVATLTKEMSDQVSSLGGINKGK
jgi:hypothetical protein